MVVKNEKENKRGFYYPAVTKDNDGWQLAESEKLLKLQNENDTEEQFRNVEWERLSHSNLSF